MIIMNSEDRRNLQMQARDFMREKGFLFDGEFCETSSNEQIKFAGRDGDERKTEWLKCQYLETSKGYPCLNITFASFHPPLEGLGNISQTFYADSDNSYSSEFICRSESLQGELKANPVQKDLDRQKKKYCV